VSVPADPTTEPRHRHPWPGLGLLEDARSVRRWCAATVNATRHNRRLRSSAPALAFYPMRPDPKARMTHVASLLGLRITFSVRSGEPVIAWDTGTWFAEWARKALPPEAINAGCVDISKTTVDRTWAAVAGYSIAVDPLTTEGPLVVKSELNGRHDGRIVRGPLAARRDGFVYERFVDSRDGDALIELRTAIVGGEIPWVIHRRRPATRWFENSTDSVLVDVRETYSDLEMAQLLDFAARLGMDYGELDVLRERETGRLYVLDANRTPHGPSTGERAANVHLTGVLIADAIARLMAQRWP
jgi:hypothetical protein